LTFKDDIFVVTYIPYTMLVATSTRDYFLIQQFVNNWNWDWWICA